ncbi:nucleolar protein 16 [Tothia fuscella]|uniref:Nucleolar protein 16 n=1 Tax=Tothia fuscella TaxID=1048955 RepID=A0A9P4NW20_9PEZI|nr:nucleolar protein 16 [Tothia fuscella]
MGRELQKKKNRSSISKVSRRPKSKKRILANPIIAANWDSQETLTQNYRRLGLASKLNHSTGGTQKTAATVGNALEDEYADDPLAINSKTAAITKTPEVRIERDPETGAILRVIEVEEANPLNDPLNEFSDTEVPAFNSLGHVPKSAQRQGVNTAVTRQLEELAANGIKRKPRAQSSREEEWIEELVGKYGDDYGKMFRDRKLNVWQQSEGDIRKRVKKWREKHKDI